MGKWGGGVSGSWFLEDPLILTVGLRGLCIGQHPLGHSCSATSGGQRALPGEQSLHEESIPINLGERKKGNTGEQMNLT